MKPAKIEDIKQYIDIKNETRTYIYLVNGVRMLEKKVKELLKRGQRPKYIKPLGTNGLLELKNR